MLAALPSEPINDQHWEATAPLDAENLIRADLLCLALWCLDLFEKFQLSHSNLEPVFSLPNIYICPQKLWITLVINHQNAKKSVFPRRKQRWSNFDQ